MSYCPKCGTKIKEDMMFCPKCGEQLKPTEAAETQAPTTTPKEVRVERVEKAEKAEKAEKHEKQEKQEKQETPEKYERTEYSWLGSLIGGCVLLLLGFMLYLVVSGFIKWENAWALFFVAIGIIIIAGGVYAAIVATKRHPRT